jgi:putative transposase
LDSQVKEDGAAAMCPQYPSDVTDRQWQLIRPLLPTRAKRGRPPLDRRVVLNAILYVVRTGCQWRQLPHDFPCWQSVYTIFWRWRRLGIWKQLHDVLRGNVRRAAGKRAQPTAAILDSQSIRTAEGGQERGYDAGKKITGRKRHLAVDTLGLIISVVVHGAYWQDHDGACFLLMRLQRACPRLKVLFADSAYARKGLPQWIQDTFGWVLHTVLRPVGAKGFVVLPKRWIVERTFAWLTRYRRHARDYERNPETSETMIYLSMIQLMSRRLARSKAF